MQDLHANSTASQQDVRSQMKTIRQSSMSEIRNVLTPDQQQKMMSMKKNGSRGRRRGPGGGQTPQA
jgi:Spy/CpxP family protein refolding chaperone